MQWSHTELFKIVRSNNLTNISIICCLQKSALQYKSTLLAAASYYSVRTNTHKYLAWYLGISTRISAEIKKVQVLLNEYLKVLKYKY